MKRRILGKELVLFLSITLLISCNIDSGDYVPIHYGYFFRNKGAQKRMIFPGNELNPNAIYADVTKYGFDDQYIIAEQAPNRESFKLELGFHLYRRYDAYSDYLKNPNVVNTYVGSSLKNRVENDSINYRIFYKKGASLLNTERDIRISYEIADSLLSNDPYYVTIFSRKVNFWIIEFSKDTMYGPFSEVEYLEKRKELNVSPILMMK